MSQSDLWKYFSLPAMTPLTFKRIEGYEEDKNIMGISPRIAIPIIILFWVVWITAFALLIHYAPVLSTLTIVFGVALLVLPIPFGSVICIILVLTSRG